MGDGEELAEEEETVTPTLDEVEKHETTNRSDMKIYFIYRYR